jgi:hypothetical protein
MVRIGIVGVGFMGLIHFLAARFVGCACGRHLKSGSKETGGGLARH